MQGVSDLMDDCFVRELKDRNKEAFKKFFNDYRHKIYGTCYMMIHDKHDAEDVVQEVFMKTYLNIHQLKNAECFNVWVYRITVNCARRFIGKNSKVKLMAIEEDDCGEYDEFDDYSLPDVVVFRKECYSALRECISRLPEFQRIAVILFYYNDMSIKEIAEIMQCKEGTVKSRLFNAKRAIKEELEEVEKGGFSYEA